MGHQLSLVLVCAFKVFDEDCPDPLLLIVCQCVETQSDVNSRDEGLVDFAGSICTELSCTVRCGLAIEVEDLRRECLRSSPVHEERWTPKHFA